MQEKRGVATPKGRFPAAKALLDSETSPPQVKEGLEGVPAEIDLVAPGHLSPKANLACKQPENARNPFRSSLEKLRGGRLLPLELRDSQGTSLYLF